MYMYMCLKKNTVSEHLDMYTKKKYSLKYIINMCKTITELSS